MNNNIIDKEEKKSEDDKESDYDFSDSSFSINEEKSKNKNEIYDYKNALPCYFNLLDNYNILQYKDIQIPRLSLINNFHFNEYEKPFNELFKKIAYDYILTSNFINIFLKISKSESKNKKKLEKSIKLNNININENSNPKNENNLNRNKIARKSVEKEKKNTKRMFNLKVYDNNKILVHKKRGRTSKKKNSRHIHSALDDDNILRKIQVHFLTFLVTFTNDYLDAISINNNKKNKYYFKQIDYNLKKTINHDSIEKMKSSTIGQILQNKASPKHKKCEDNINQIIYNNLCEKYPDIKENYFNKLFKEFFIEFYYNKSDNPIIVNGIKVNLSIKTNNFNKLLQKNINYSIKYKNVAAYFYLDIKKEEIKLKRHLIDGREKPFFIVD